MHADEEGTYAALLAKRNEVINPRIKEFGGRRCPRRTPLGVACRREAKTYTEC